MRARQTAAEHADADVRARAGEAVAKWENVIAGMQAGTIDVGTRTPTTAPTWVTLEVVTGGFATGGFSAGGPLRAHERALAERLGLAPKRVALNLHYLASAEAAELVASGQYRIEVPEEGASLVVAWLRARGEIDRANDLVETLSPWLESLRFFPVPAERPLELKESVRLQDLGTTLKGLDVDRRQPRFETMRDAVLVWKPLRARAIALFAATVDGELPRLDANGVSGGWPGTTIPDGWHARVAELAAEVGRLGQPRTARARETAQLISQLVRCSDDSQALAKAEYQAIRRTIARHLGAHGLAGSAEDDVRRGREVQAVSAPLHADLRRVLVARLRALPSDGGVEPVGFASVSVDEAARFGVPAGAALPRYLERKVARSYDAPLQDLVDRGVIASAEVLARVLPQVTARVRAETLDDVAARRLYSALYAAFRRRRGLLLLDYQHQVRFHELPWVAALEAARRASAESTGRARKAVAAIGSVALLAFPYTITPNKLVTELGALAHAADLELPLVEELAADIFMGSFTPKFVAAAKISARLLRGTLYQRYFAIDVDEVLRIPTANDQVLAEFAALCERRAAPLEGTSRSFVARNGKVIEQAQILTTHNLAVLVDALPLRDELAPHLRSVAEACFHWAVGRMQLRTTKGHQVLINLKNAAYAWRQMVFYLSFAPDLPEFLQWARAEVERRAFPRFEPVLRGLELAASGVASNEPAFATGGGRVFTGWSTDRHWLSPS
ncbi:MAG: hypothetical protein IPQ07_37375 [Myxococcales bacterium]|nr:hypothetical protein [Myxococcales bacterium]